MAAGMVLTLMVGGNLTKPLGEIIQVLQKLEIEPLKIRFKGRSNDEIDCTGDVIDELTEGLMERDRLQHSLAILESLKVKLIEK